MALADYKLTIGWPNIVDLTTLSGGSYTAARPLANAQVRELQERARSVDLDPANTQFLATYDRRRTTGAVAVAAHNLSAEAQARIRLRDAVDATVYDSGWLPVWPGVLGPAQLEWEDDNFWLGTLTDEQRAEYTPLYVHAFEPRVDVHSALVEFSDPGNADGFVEFGRVFIGDVRQFEENVEFGVEWGVDDGTTITESGDSGAEFFDVGPRRRTFTARFGTLNADEAFNYLARLQRVAGTSGEILLLENLQQTPQTPQRQMLARLAELDRLAHPYFQNWRSAITAREIL